MTYSKEIPLNGLSTSPSDYQSSDGDLSAAVNVLHEGGSAQNSKAYSPTILMKLDTLVFNKDYDGSTYSCITGIELYYIHVKPTKRHAIIKGVFGAGTNMYFALDVEKGYPKKLSDVTILYRYRFKELDGKDVTSALGFKNVLIFYLEDEVIYYRWNGEVYEYLGNHMPEISIGFGLNTFQYKTSDSLAGSEGTTYQDLEAFLPSVTLSARSIIDSSTIHEADLAAFNDAVYGVLNKFTGGWCDEHGYFSQPFFVRYAYRMFDGSLTMASAPILMLANYGLPNPIVNVMSFREPENIMTLNAEGKGHQLCYYVVDVPDGFDRWSDIIKSVDIFVSKPFYSYDQSGTCREVIVSSLAGYLYASSQYKGYYLGEFKEGNISNSAIEIQDYKPYTPDNKTMYSGTSATSKGTAIGEYEKVVDDSNIWERFKYYVDSSHYCPCSRVVLPVNTNQDKEAKDNGLFYFVHSIPISELKKDDVINGISAGGTPIVIPKGVMNSITTREVMTDDYDSHHTIIPSNSFVYNDRLHVSSYKKQLFDGFNPKSVIQNVRWNIDKNELIAFTTIKRDGIVFVRKSPVCEVIGGNIDVRYYFYPDVNAQSVTLFRRYDDYADNGSTRTVKKLTLPMNECVSINGACYFNGVQNSKDWVVSSESEILEFESQVNNDVFEETFYENETRSSDVQNPFVFSAQNVNTIGNGKIISMVPAAVAMSEGQFGEFPMYAFTTDGVWALSVSETGGWKSKQPISRDVALNKGMILQLDQQVLFATDRGLMLINGSKIECITEIFDGYPDQFLSIASSHIAAVLGDYSDIQYEDMPPFREFIRDGNMHYDYKNQRIIIGNPKHRFCYIFNMKDRVWTSEQLQIDSAINSYPDAQAIAISDSKKLLVNLSETSAYSAITPTDGFILTRPLKIDQPDTFKTIRTVIVRGNFATNSIGPTPGSVDIILYASRDMSNWQVIGSTRGDRLTMHHGTPYKYFRVGIISHLKEGESISGLTIEYEPKQTNRLR